MNLLFLVLLSIILLALGYFFYGSLIKKLLGLDDSHITPANKFRDGMDYEPTNKFYLLGQHLSAIAAAGPIVGPILAGMWFGWLPAILWIILGGIFIGGIHDFTALVASLRHQGKSIAEVIKENMSKRAFVLFLLFLWFSLMYIITAFTDITSATFIDAQRGPGVASSSMMYLVIALVMGIVLQKFKQPLFISTLIFLPLIFVCIYLGPIFPLKITPFLGLSQRAIWNIFLLLYCFIASTIPVWLLLQPRGYLGGFFLVVTVVVSFIGLVIGVLTRSFFINYPAFISWNNPGGLPLLPILFTTIACGACSGFHALVSSGTTSKQISKESDAKLVGYGGMLLESFVAIIALSTLLVINTKTANDLKDPNMIYANGIAQFLNTFGLSREFALNFALLAFATFVYDTLDVATRLGRYIFEELLNWRSKISAYLASFATLILPFVFVTQNMVDSQGKPISVWKVLWSVFGSSNQLLAGFVLFAISIWLFKTKRKFIYTLLPAIFMIFVSVISFFFILKPFLLNLSLGKINFEPIGITSILLLILSFMLIAEGVKIFIKNR